MPVSGLFTPLTRPIQGWSGRIYQRLLRLTRPDSRSLLTGTFTDLPRTKAEQHRDARPGFLMCSTAEKAFAF